MFFVIMTVLDLFTKLYGRLHSERFHYRLLTPPRYIVRSFANRILPNYLAKSHTISNRVIEGLVVSFTSFPARINNVWQVVECLSRQTYLPEKIILWLSSEQFPSEKEIPESLKCRLNDRFEIRFVEGDIRSHKKYHYISKLFPEKYVFLIDDDIYYPTSLIENTWRAHLANPNAVICNYGFHIHYDERGELKPYNQWKRVYADSCSNAIFFGSGGGTLIKPALLYSDFEDIDLALQLTPTADDIWLNAMVNLARINKILLKNRQILPICIKDDSKLASQNRENNQNDRQLENIINYYKKKIGLNPFK